MPFIACYSVTIANRKRSPWFYLRDEHAGNNPQEATRFPTTDAACEALDIIRTGLNQREFKFRVLEVRV